MTKSIFSPPHPRCLAADPPSLPVDTSACKEVAPGSFGLMPSLSMLILWTRRGHPLPCSLWGCFLFCLSFSLLLDDTLFISLLPVTVGLDFGLSCFFMWLLCFWVAGDRGWSVSAPVLGTVTIPGETECENSLVSHF